MGARPKKKKESSFNDNSSETFWQILIKFHKNVLGDSLPK